jgi:hypothetical protein
VSTTARHWPASSTSCAPASPGGCCLLASWAAAARLPVGGGCVTGSALASGGNSTTCCWRSWPPGPAGLVAASLDSISVRAKRGGCLTGPNPTDRGKPEASTTCWSTEVVSRWRCACRRPTSTTRCCWGHGRRHRAGQGAAGPPGATPASGPPSCTWTRPTTTPLSAGAAPARDHAPDRPSWRRVQPAAGRHRYVVERSLVWLVGYRRVQVRYERRADTLLGFLHLACALICLKSLHRPKGEGDGGQLRCCT